MASAHASRIVPLGLRRMGLQSLPFARAAVAPGAVSSFSRQFARQRPWIGSPRWFSCSPLRQSVVAGVPSGVNGHYEHSTIVHQEEPLDDLDEDQISEAARLRKNIWDTNFHGPEGEALLDGLDVYTVPALEDHHPLSVYGLDSLDPAGGGGGGSKRFPVLLLHGRTWSSVPVYHLLGGDLSKNPLVQGEEVHESRSLMENLYKMGLQPYAMDFRGFGGTPKDETGYVEPHRCVQDVETVLLWIAKRHGTEMEMVAGGSGKYSSNHNVAEMPALLGWSQGALIAQLVAQAHPTLLSRLVLYGSIYDPLVRYPREPLYQVNKPNLSQIPNTFNDAIEDFTVQGTIPPEPARLFAEAALVTDPIKAIWKHVYQFNNCDPARVLVPTLVVCGDQDPYAPLHVQQELFCNLGRGMDRTWSILAEADHAAHLLDEAMHRFVNITTSFITNGKRTELAR
jgi:pimeloyl-ACP methyl ester carboxylesterase